MTTYYVGSGGNNGNSGTSWANRKATINGAEDVPVAAGDTVYVGPGVYRESLTIDVAGTAGNPITYIADVTGEHTDGVGGTVRIAASDDDGTNTRASCITAANARSYRTFRGFLIDSATSSHILLSASSDHWIIEDCVFQWGTTVAAAIQINGTGGSHTIRRCNFWVLGPAVQIIHTSTVNSSANLIENCVLLCGGTASAIRVDRVGGVTIKNCLILSGENGPRVVTALAAGQVLTVNNCIITGTNTALTATTTAEFSEDYNNVFGNVTARSNVTAGANSVAYPPVFDIQNMLSGFFLPAKTGFALSKWSLLAHKTGTSPSSDDFYGMERPATGSEISWGPIQSNQVARETGTVQGGSVSLKLPYAGEQFIMRVPVTNVSTTISLYVYRQTDYAGSAPQMIIKQPNQSNRTTTDAGSATTWNQLSDTFTPSAIPGYVDIFVKSRNTATTGSYAVFVDTIAVS